MTTPATPPTKPDQSPDLDPPSAKAVLAAVAGALTWLAAVAAAVIAIDGSGLGQICHQQVAGNLPRIIVVCGPPTSDPVVAAVVIGLAVIPLFFFLRTVVSEFSFAGISAKLRSVDRKASDAAKAARQVNERVDLVMAVAPPRAAFEAQMAAQSHVSAELSSEREDLEREMLDLAGRVEIGVMVAGVLQQHALAPIKLWRNTFSYEIEQVIATRNVLIHTPSTLSDADLRARIVDAKRLVDSMPGTK